MHVVCGGMVATADLYSTEQSRSSNESAPLTAIAYHDRPASFASLAGRLADSLSNHIYSRYHSEVVDRTNIFSRAGFKVVS